MIVSSIVISILFNLYTIKGDDCQYSTNDGILDLKTLGYKDRPKYTDIHDSSPRVFLTYSFNGCFPYSTKDTCQNAAACVTEEPSKTTRLIARQAGRTFTYTQGLSTMIYTDGAGSRVQVFLVCAVNETIQVTRNDDKFYIFRIESRCACPGKCSYLPDKSPNGLTVGGIFVIMFISILATYLIVSVFFLRFVKHEQGINLIPHRKVWLQMISDSIIGVRFILSKVTRRGSYENV